MARNNKRKTIGTDQKLAIAERELSKGNPKEALKLARDCYRIDPSQSVRSVLQRSLVSRSKELYARALHDPARDIVRELSGMTDLPDELQHELTRLRLVLGVDQNSSSLDATQWAVLADQAVMTGVAPHRKDAVHEAFETQARAVREALQEVEVADHVRAIELISGIDRESPYSDWKLFVRGLCAFYERDVERTTANWSRLAEGRVARTLAESLLCTRDPERFAAVAEKIRRCAERLQKSAEWPEPQTMEALAAIVHREASTWKSHWSEVEQFVKRYGRSRPDLVRRVAQAFFLRTFEQENEHAFDLLCSTFPAPPIDPHYYRARGQFGEAANDLEDMEYCWQRYLDDWKTYSGVSATQKRIGEALIYQRLGAYNAKAAAEEAESGRRCQCAACLRRYEQEGEKFDYEDKEYRERLLQDAVKFLRASLAVDASLSESHRLLCEALTELGEMEEADKALETYAQSFSESPAVLSYAAKYFLKTLKPEQAKQYANQSRALAPRDEASLSLLWSAILGTTYKALSRKDFRSAKGEIEELETLARDDVRPAWMVPTLHAAAALANGKFEVAGQQIEEAVQRIGHPTAALMIVDSHLRRCYSGDKRRKDLKDKLTAALGKQISTVSAGVMAQHLYECDVNHVKYTGLATHYKQLLQYIEACVTRDWSLKHWVDVYTYVRRQNKPLLLAKLLKVGRKQFPTAAYVNFFTGAAEMDKGPYARSKNLNLAVRSFEAALATADQGELPLDEATRKACARGLELADENERPRINRGWRAEMGFDDDDDGDEYDDDEDYEDDFYGVDAGGLKLSQMSEEEKERMFQELLKELPPNVRAAVQKLGIKSYDDFLRIV